MNVSREGKEESECSLKEAVPLIQRAEKTSMRISMAVWGLFQGTEALHFVLKK